MRKRIDPRTLQDYAEAKVAQQLAQGVPKLTAEQYEIVMRDPMLKCSVRKAMRANGIERKLWVEALERLIREQIGKRWWEGIQARWEMRVLQREPKRRTR